VNSKYALRQISEPEEIAEVVAFLVFSTSRSRPAAFLLGRGPHFETSLRGIEFTEHDP
jgi:hypothetical protein